MASNKWALVQKLSTSLLLCVCTLLPATASSQDLKFNFASPNQAVQIAPTEAPGVWYVDRYAPCGFVSPATSPAGKPTLEESICASDSAANRPPAYSDPFYNTQGRKYDLPQTVSLTISLYVPATWATENARKAGFWATAFDSTSAVGDYPIIEFQGAINSGPYANGGVPGFYGWNNTGPGSWNFIGLPPGFKYDTWVELTITLLPGTGFQYTVGNNGPHSVSIISPASDPTDVTLGNVILQGYNYGSNYSIFWDMLSASPKP